jgi:phage shock protein A
MPFLELVIFRLLIWIVPPLALITLAVGPGKLWRSVKRGWNWLTRRRLAPEEILNQVVQQLQQHVAAVRKVIAQGEKADEEIQFQLATSEDNMAQLEGDARRLTAANDELGARAALYKLTLERTVSATFSEQLARQKKLIDESRQRLYLLELQLRQYEVGKSILLSQLAQAEKVEQQFAIANQFDPFNAVANWQKAEGMVLEKQLNARAIERVYTDTRELATGGQTVEVDATQLDAELARLRAEVAKNPPPPVSPTPQRAGKEKRMEEEAESSEHEQHRRDRAVEEIRRKR